MLPVRVSRSQYRDQWISADEEVATARGGGGGLALWKREVEELAVEQDEA